MRRCKEIVSRTALAIGIGHRSAPDCASTRSGANLEILKRIQKSTEQRIEACLAGDQAALSKQDIVARRSADSGVLERCSVCCSESGIESRVSKDVEVELGQLIGAARSACCSTD